jgi:hypothetical protein
LHFVRHRWRAIHQAFAGGIGDHETCESRKRIQTGRHDQTEFFESFEAGTINLKALYQTEYGDITGPYRVLGLLPQRTGEVCSILARLREAFRPLSP